MIRLYNDYAIKSYLPYSLADRDFDEQYNISDTEAMPVNPRLHGVLKAIQKKYIDEFERYGVIHLRLEEDI